jgi:hypothetical protein
VTAAKRDPAFDALLDVDGETFVIDPAGKHWVKFTVKRVPVTPERPHGLKYSLTLHNEAGDRVVGFDNAHAVKGGSGPGAVTPAAHDHRHRLKSVRPYEYKGPADLLEDFWREVDAMLKMLGVKT